MAQVPQSAGGNASMPQGDPMTLNYLQSIIDATSGLSLFHKPSVEAIIQMYPKQDGMLRLLLENFVGENVMTEMTAYTEWYISFVERVFGKMTVAAHGAAAGPGLSITVTINSGYINGAAAAYDSHNYMILIGGVRYLCYANPGGVNSTVNGAWTVVLFPKDPTVTLPASVTTEPIICMDPQVAEGNTVHSGSGRQLPIYTEQYGMVPHEVHKVIVTDLAAFSQPSYMEGQVMMLDGTPVNATYWQNVQFDLGILEWQRQRMHNRMMGSGDVTPGDTIWKYASIGIDQFIETRSGNVFTWNPGGIGDADVLSWIDGLRANYEGVTEYLIIPGINFRRALNTWMKGPHFSGQIVELKLDNINLDVVKFTWETVTFYMPITQNMELDNPDGYGAFGFSNEAYIIPKTKIQVQSADGTSRPALRWKTLKNGNTMYPGIQGQWGYYWKIGPSFRKAMLNIPAFAAAPQDFYIPIEDARCELGATYIEGSEFVKPYLFAKITL